MDFGQSREDAARAALPALLDLLPDAARERINKHRHQATDTVWYEVARVAIRLSPYLGEPNIITHTDGTAEVEFFPLDPLRSCSVHVSRFWWTWKHDFSAARVTDLTELVRLAIQTKAKAEAP